MDRTAISHETWPINGIMMRVARAGSGPAVVLLHGFPELWYSWRRVIPMLAPRFSVFAPDLRGMGGSEVSRGGYDTFNLARDVAEVIERAGQGAPVLLVGHDWGGVIGWHVAASYPSLVSGYVAAAGPHPARYSQLLRTDRRQLFMSLYTLFFQVPLLPELALTLGRGAVMMRFMQRSMVRPGALAPEEALVYREAWSSFKNMRAGLNYYRAAARSMARSSHYYKGHKVRCPSLVVWGDSDKYLSLAQTRGLERWCEPEPRVKIIPHCGHWIAQEAPEELCDAIMEFHHDVKAAPAEQKI
ncbi:MAG TPA: alpha/beta fold hydrolase [bacterium]|nr:alpha/beta fold hydrolase [bacterium]